MSLESSASLWDGLSWWLIAIGATLAFFGTIAGAHARKLGRELGIENATIAAREKATNDRAIAEANERAAEANKTAEQEHVARLKLEQSLAPRIITLGQAMPMIAALKEFRGQKYIFVTYQDDKEAVAFTSQINAVLTNAGWVVERSKGFLAFALQFNVSATTDPASNVKTVEARTTLVRVFNEQGIRTTGNVAPAPTGEPDTIQITVGKKP